MPLINNEVYHNFQTGVNIVFFPLPIIWNIVHVAVLLDFTNHLRQELCDFTRSDIYLRYTDMFARALEAAG